MMRLFNGVVLCLASTVMVTKSESTPDGRIVDSNADIRRQLQQEEADVAAPVSSGSGADHFFDLMEGAKRAWKDLPGSGWGKRSWQDLQSSGWGKRGWQDLQTSGWGKRGWQDLQTSGWGKRAWQNLPSSGWGKRAPRTAYQNSWATKSRNGFDGSGSGGGGDGGGGAEKLMADEISDADATDAMIAEDDDTIDAVKKAWNSLKGPWGKRDASDWGSMKGAWGKRDPAWHNLKGLWGKRSSSLTDNFYNIVDSQDSRSNL